MKIENRVIFGATDQNFATLLSTTTPLLVSFGTNWCPACKLMEPILSELATEFSGLATVAKIDAEDNSNLISDYGIRNVPSILLFKNGQLLQRFTGALKKKLSNQLYTLARMEVD